MNLALSGFRRRIFLSVLTVSLGSGLCFAAPQQAAKPSGSAPAAKSAPAPQAGTSSNSRYGADDSGKLDLNTATLDELKAIPGIGDAYAKRIIAGRPYTAKNQLTQRGILPQKVYDSIKDSIIAHRVAKK